MICANCRRHLRTFAESIVDIDAIVCADRVACSIRAEAQYREARGMDPIADAGRPRNPDPAKVIPFDRRNDAKAD
jgi:hypothetical protein